MLKRNGSFNKRNRKVENKKEIDDYIRMLKIKIEKTDFESIDCFEIKIDLLTALAEKNYKKLSETLEKLLFSTQQKGIEEREQIFELKFAIEQLLRLVNL